MINIDTIRIIFIITADCIIINIMIGLLMRDVGKLIDVIVNHLEETKKLIGVLTNGNEEDSKEG